jgi:signal transduction histidine kinase
MGGLACYALSAARGTLIAPLAEWGAPILFAMAIVAACASRNRLNLSCRDLTRQLRSRPSAPPASLSELRTVVMTAEPALAEMVAAMNQVLRAADRAVTEAGAKIRELEHRLYLIRDGNISGASLISLAGHELRTPLASIKAYIEMLIDGEASDQKTTQEFYDVIQDEANRLNRLIDEILTIVSTSQRQRAAVESPESPESSRELCPSI